MVCRTIGCPSSGRTNYQNTGVAAGRTCSFAVECRQYCRQMFGDPVLVFYQPGLRPALDLTAELYAYTVLHGRPVWELGQHPELRPLTQALARALVHVRVFRLLLLAEFGGQTQFDSAVLFCFLLLRVRRCRSRPAALASGRCRLLRLRRRFCRHCAGAKVNFPPFSSQIFTAEE